jgi:hypothetical protein
MNILKTEIKKLTEAIGKVYAQNEMTNEMDALFDYGEWSGSEPDFSQLIKNWNLTAEKMQAYIIEARRLAELFYQYYPKENFIPQYEKGITYIADINKWEHNYRCLISVVAFQYDESIF